MVIWGAGEHTKGLLNVFVGRKSILESIMYIVDKPRQSYMTDVLQELINREFKTKAVDVSGGWLEIDTLKDYEIEKQ